MKSSLDADAFAALLNDARSGGEAASGWLLEAYNPYLNLLARAQIRGRLLGKVDPADVVQETFLDAHRQLPGFRGATEREFSAWLRRILAGQLALTLRRFLGTKGRDIHLERDLQTQLDESSQAMDRGLVASISTPSQQVSRREQALLLAEALERLPADYREILILRHIESLTFADAAARMGRSENSVYKL